MAAEDVWLRLFKYMIPIVLCDTWTWGHSFDAFAGCPRRSLHICAFWPLIHGRCSSFRDDWREPAEPRYHLFCFFVLRCFLLKVCSLFSFFFFVSSTWGLGPAEEAVNKTLTYDDQVFLFNLLANNCLITHPAVRARHYHSFGVSFLANTPLSLSSAGVSKTPKGNIWLWSC